MRTGQIRAFASMGMRNWKPGSTMSRRTERVKEALSFGMSFFQLPRQNFIRRFQPLPGKEGPKSSMAFRTEENPNRLALTIARNDILTSMWNVAGSRGGTMGIGKLAEYFVSSFVVI